MSVFVGDGRVAFDPRHVTAGPVTLLVANESPHSHSVVLTLPGGRVVARTPEVEPGGTAQFKTTLDLEVIRGQDGRSAFGRAF